MRGEEEAARERQHLAVAPAAFYMAIRNTRNERKKPIVLCLARSDANREVCATGTGKKLATEKRAAREPPRSLL